jgi:proline iminopeptidase
MPERFPAIEPWETGMLDVGDGQRIYWEASGNPAGKPAAWLEDGQLGGDEMTVRMQEAPNRFARR